MIAEVAKKGSVRRVFWIVLVITALVALFFGWRYYRYVSQEAEDPLMAIPSGTVMIAEWSDPSQFINVNLAENALWKDLLGDSAWNHSGKVLLHVDSLLAAELPPRQRKLGARTVLTIQRTGAGVYQPLLLVVMPNGGKAALRALLQKYGSEQGHGSERYFEFSLPGSGGPFYACMRKGIMIGSPEKSLLQRACARLSGGGQENAEIPGDFSDWTGQRVDFHLFVSMKQLSRFIGARMVQEGFEISRMVSEFAGIVELDFLVREDDIAATGHTIASDSSGHHLSTFKGQEAPAIRLHEVLPYHTKRLLHFGMNDMGMWYEKWNPAAPGAFADDPWLSWAEQEIGLAVVNDAGSREETVGIFRVRDHELARRNLIALSKPASGVPDTLTYRSYIVGRVLGNNPFGPRLGHLWEGFNNPWFTMLDDYVVFSNSKQVVTDLINQYLAGNTLVKAEEYARFQQNISTSSNVYLYADLSTSPDLFPDWLDTAVYARHVAAFSNAGSGILGIQWEWTKNDTYFTNLYYSTTSYSAPAVKATSWQTRLDANVQSGPYAVYDHKEGNRKIIVFDADNNMYLVDASGTIIWKAHISEAPVSRVYEVDLYRNNKIQYLFNTASKVYLVDLNGNLVPGFPWRLPDKALGPVSVFDYEGSKDYRLVVQGTDKRLYNYYIDGRPVRGWNLPMLDASVQGYIEHVRLNTKDIIVCHDESGKVYILNRRGEERITIKQSVRAARYSGFFTDKSRSRHRLLLTDTAGRVAEISQGGDLSFLKLGDFGPDHHYVFADFNGNGVPQHIVLDGDRVKVYDMEGRLEFTDSLGLVPDNEVRVEPVEGFGQCLIAHSSANGRIVLMNSSGMIQKFDAFRGVLPPLVTRLSDESPQLLVSGEANMLYLYPLE